MSEYTYTDLRNEFNMDNDGGEDHILLWLGEICDFLYWECSEDPPAEWKYHAGHSYDHSGDNYELSVIRLAGRDAALKLGWVLQRYRSMIGG